MSAYYNEHDPFAAAWLRELIAEGLIAPGEVDERSIEDVRPDDLRGFRQCHWFAGIGGWSYALRLAGIPDDYPVWTGSCPCQPFSTAGKRGGFDDERHLWPAFHWHIAQSRPAIVIGEQVAAAAADPWLDLVQADLEQMGYAFGCIAFPAASVGAPHIRDRAYWVADATERGLGEQRGAMEPGDIRHADSGIDTPGSMADTDSERRNGQQVCLQSGQPRQAGAETAGGGGYGGVADANDERLEGRRGERERTAKCSPGQGGLVGGVADTLHAKRWPVHEHRENGCDGQDRRRKETHGKPGTRDEVCHPGTLNGFWRDADWLYCRDGKWRPVAPGTFPLASRIPNRVGMLRGAGNAIVPQAAAEFIKAAMTHPAETVEP